MALCASRRWCRRDIGRRSRSGKRARLQLLVRFGRGAVITIAPFEPAPEIVSKLKSSSWPVSRRTLRADPRRQSRPAPRRRLGVEPGEKPAQRGAVAHMRVARALKFDRVFARLQRHARVGGLDQFRASAFQTIGDLKRGLRRIGDNFRALLDQAGKHIRQRGEVMKDGKLFQKARLSGVTCPGNVNSAGLPERGT